MADSVALGGIEEHHLVRFRYRLVAPKVAHIGASIREDKLRRRRILFGALAATTPQAVYVTNPDGRRLEQGLSVELRDIPIFVIRGHAPPLGSRPEDIILPDATRGAGAFACQLRLHAGFFTACQPLESRSPDCWSIKLTRLKSPSRMAYRDFRPGKSTLG
jgi:hypothetical protein